MRSKSFFKDFKLALVIALLSLIVLTTVRLATSTSAQTYTTYTGYQVIGNYTTLRVEGSWIVPAANCTATPSSVSNISVIIDGISGEGDAMEIGTYQDCTNGTASYGAFVNVYPMTQYYGEVGGNISDVVVSPGDVVEAQGTWRNSTTPPINWNTNFIDETTNTTVDTDAETNSSFTPVLNSGALILSSEGQTLTQFTSPVYSGKDYTGVNFSDITGDQRYCVTFGKEANTTGFSLVTWQMPGTVIGSLSADGSSFEITEAPISTTSSTTTTASPASTSSSSTTSTTTATLTCAAQLIGGVCTTSSSMSSSSSSSSFSSNTGISGGNSAYIIYGATAVILLVAIVSAILILRR